MSVDPSKHLIHRQDSSKHRFFSGCAIFNFFCAWPSLGFKLRPMPQIQAVCILQLPRRLISSDPFLVSGASWSGSFPQTPWKSSGNSETHKTPPKMLPIRLKLIRKKQLQLSVNCWYRKMLLVCWNLFERFGNFSTQPSVRLTRNGSFLYS